MGDYIKMGDYQRLSDYTVSLAVHTENCNIIHFVECYYSIIPHFVDLKWNTILRFVDSSNYFLSVDKKEIAGWWNQNAGRAKNYESRKTSTTSRPFTICLQRGEFEKLQIW